MTGRPTGPAAGQPRTAPRVSRRTALLGGAAMLGAAALAAAGCGRQRLRDAVPGALVLAVEEQPRQLDPHLAASLAERRLAALLFTPLVGTDDRPGLAASWEQRDGPHWRFALRASPGIDPGGLPAAEVVRWNVERLARLRASGDLPDAGAGLPVAAAVVAREVVDLEFDATIAVVPEALGTFYLVPPTYYAANPAEVAARAPRGSGPYQLASWTRERLVLKRVPAAASAEGIDRLLWLTDTASDPRVAMAIAGEADVAPDLGLQDLYRATAAGLSIVTTEDAGCVHAQLDARVGALADPRVRQGLNLAVNRPRLLKQQYEGRARPLAGICNGQWENRALSPYPYDPGQARALFEAAGLTYRDDTLYDGDYPLSLPILTDAEYEPAARALGRDLERVGITTIISSLSSAALEGARRRPSPFGMIVSYIGGSASGVGELRWVDSRFRHDLAPGVLATDPAFQDRLDALAGASSPDALRAGVAALQQDVLDQAPWLFLFRLPRYTAYRGAASKLDLAPTGEILLG
ncbi:MAG TPA: ABC transporter substrate-binding protein [Chloroflexota bacterium]